MSLKLTGLVAAAHTPFHADGELNLSVVELQAGSLLSNDVRTVFIGGTTGESHSLQLDERLALAKRWSEVAAGSRLQLVIHVGANCLADARAMAAQAEEIGATAIAALAPSYFKPRTVDDLVSCCAAIADAAPGLPFYYYDIPSLTGVQLAMPSFLEMAPARIPALAGIKFSNPDLMAYQHCLHAQDGRFDVPWGVDECLLAALALGATGAVGSTYNFAAPLYHRLMAAFSRGDLAAARVEQYRAVQMVDLLASFGYMAAAKSVMGLLGVEVGPARLPHASLKPEQRTALQAGLDRIGFFDWGVTAPAGRG